MNDLIIKNMVQNKSVSKHVTETEEADANKPNSIFLHDKKNKTNFAMRKIFASTLSVINVFRKAYMYTCTSDLI